MARRKRTKRYEDGSVKLKGGGTKPASAKRSKRWIAQGRFANSGKRSGPTRTPGRPTSSGMAKQYSPKATTRVKASSAPRPQRTGGGPKKVSIGTIGKKGHVRLGAGLRKKVQAGTVSRGVGIKRALKKPAVSKKQRTRRAAFRSGRRSR